MLLCASVDLLAQLMPEWYADPFKLAGIVAAFVLWALFAQWVDKDAIAVNTYRDLWNLVVMGTGTAAVVLAFLVPTFVIGFPLMAVIDLAVMISYVIHRNRLVPAEQTVATLAHFARMKQQGIFGKKKKQVKEVKERVRLTGADRKVVQIPEQDEERERYALTQDLVFDALWRRAAIVEIVPAGQASKITCQIDGVVSEREALVRPEGDAVVLFLKQIAGLNIEERRKPQRGRIVAAIGENKFPVVIETAGSTAGEKLRLRVIGPEGKAKAADLGFNPKQLEVLRTIMDRPRGLVLLSGPPGSGLTTTFYSFMRSHDAFMQNIQSLEYDKEIEVDNITQKVYTPADDKTFTSELQKLIRSDPDLVFFPELREREAAVIISQAAADKVRIYVALPAEDVFEALKKWTALVGDRSLVAKSLWLVANQRLVRKLCTECRQPYKPEPAMLRKLNMPADAVLHRPPEAQYDKHGNPIVCQACQGTGHVGRTAVFDLLVVDDELRPVIRSAASISEVQTFAVKRGGLGLQGQGIQKVLDGVTSIQEIVRVLRSGSGRPSGGAPGQPAPRPKPQPVK